MSKSAKNRSTANLSAISAAKQSHPTAAKPKTKKAILARSNLACSRCSVYRQMPFSVRQAAKSRAERGRTLSLVYVFRDLEHIGRSVVVKFHGQPIRREDVVGDLTAPLSGNVFI